MAEWLLTMLCAHIYTISDNNDLKPFTDD